jgi:hypothetical protein
MLFGGRRSPKNRAGVEKNDQVAPKGRRHIADAKLDGLLRGRSLARVAESFA